MVLRIIKNYNAKFDKRTQERIYKKGFFSDNNILGYCVALRELY